MSTNSNWVSITALDPAMSAIFWRRGSGTATRPTLGSMVQKGYLADCAAAVSVSALNRVDLPDRKRVVLGKCVSVRVVLCGPRIIQQNYYSSFAYLTVSSFLFI